MMAIVGPEPAWEARRVLESEAAVRRSRVPMVAIFGKFLTFNSPFTPFSSARRSRARRIRRMSVDDDPKRRDALVEGCYA